MTSDDRLFLTHREPVWRERSDFIIMAELHERDGRFEQLWARQVDSDAFELCCIPFFLYGLALGDVVRTSPREWCGHVLDGVVERSGHFTFRVWLGDTAHPRHEVTERLEAGGAVLEWSSANMVAVDVSDEERAGRMGEQLAAAEASGELLFETGW